MQTLPHHRTCRNDIRLPNHLRRHCSSARYSFYHSQLSANSYLGVPYLSWDPRYKRILLRPPSCRSSLRASIHPHTHPPLAFRNRLQMRWRRWLHRVSSTHDGFQNECNTYVDFTLTCGRLVAPWAPPFQLHSFVSTLPRWCLLGGNGLDHDDVVVLCWCVMVT